MVRIKSAQFTNMPPPKPFPGGGPETLRYDREFCKGCQESKDTNELEDGFCENCLMSGLISECGNCRAKVMEGNGIETQNGIMCNKCGEDLYDDRGQYVGPRREYYNGRPEDY